MLQMFTHGTITGGLFLLVGVLYDRAHTRDLNGFGGLGVRIAGLCGHPDLFRARLARSSALSGFVSEFLALLGSLPVFQTRDRDRDDRDHPRGSVSPLYDPARPARKTQSEMGPTSGHPPARGPDACTADVLILGIGIYPAHPGLHDPDAGRSSKDHKGLVNMVLKTFVIPLRLLRAQIAFAMTSLRGGEQPTKQSRIFEGL